MLLNLKEYHRPGPDPHRERSFDSVLALLARPEVKTVVLAGGDALLASRDASVEAVADLQGLGLNYLQQEPSTDELVIGAMVTRAELANDEAARSLASGALCQGARCWGGNVQRNRATVGGAVVVGQPNDCLILALLACGAAVKLYTSAGYWTLSLADFLLQRASLLVRPALVVEIAVPEIPATARGALASVARTPSDAPIVAACAVIEAVDGQCRHAGLALGGVADAPLAMPEATQMLAGQPLTHERIANAAALAGRIINPPADFRGSSEYRRAMAEILSARVLTQASGLLTQAEQ